MEQCESQIRKLVSSGTAYKRISQLLQESNPGVSVRRFCQQKEISYLSHLDDREVDQAIETAIREVGNG